MLDSESMCDGLVNSIAHLYSLDRCSFDSPAMRLASDEFKERCRSSEALQSRKRQLRTFQSNLTVWADGHKRIEFVHRVVGLLGEVKPAGN